MHTSHLRTALRVFTLVVLFGLAGAQAAHAEFKLLSTGASLTDSDGQFSRQAGAHVDLLTHFEVSGADADTSMHLAEVDLPPGIVGNPTIAPTCPFNQIVLNGSIESDCPVDAAVGMAEIKMIYSDSPLRRLVYNVDRPGNAPALFGFNYFGAAVKIEPRIRGNDYGITAASVGITQALVPVSVDVRFWGVPADPSHDRERSPQYEATGEDSIPVPSPAPRTAFLSSPTSCSEAASIFTVSVDSWANPGAFLTRSFDRDLEGTPFVFTGCDRVPFDPAVELRQQSQAAAAPLGLDVELRVPQNNAPDGLASAHVRKTVVTFPKGMSISPAAAAGQGACSEAQIGIGSNAAPTCPDSSRLGTVRIETPLLDEELEGSLYLAEQRKNPFGSLLATYLAVKGPGFYLKLPGKIEANPGDGQLTATFDNQPQLPYEKVSLSLRGGSGAPLVAPSACGTYSAQIQMTSWASQMPVTLDAPITINQNCGGGGFDPVLRAGTSNPVAGAFSPFLLRLIREDGEQNVSRIDATLPGGLLAKLAGVPLCDDAAAATGACPAASQIGRTTVAVGAGETPLYVPEAGKSPTAVYLAGPYKGAPYSLVVKVPAQAGPFDLGTVAVRSGIYVDSETARVTVKSDPLPQILEGIPLAYRDVRVEVDRPDFMLNPTGCLPQQVTSSIASAEGAIVNPAVRFAVAGCERLGFKPKLKLALKGSTTRSGHPSLRSSLTPRVGDANIGGAVVILPPSLQIDNAHINNPCTRVQFNAGQCPSASVLGTARAVTPLLDQPLEGPVYFRSNGGDRELPDVVADLHGAFDIVLVGFVDSVPIKGTERAKLRTRFLNVPDAPVSKFQLNLFGGKRGLLVNNRNLCGGKQRAKLRLTGHNGKTVTTRPVLANGCGGKGRKTAKTATGRRNG